MRDPKVEMLLANYPISRLFCLADGYNACFPDGNEPYRIATRLLEEAGEVAAEVNHFEKSGVKREKKGEPDKHAMAGEIKQAMNALVQLARYYGVEKELMESIEESIVRRQEFLAARQSKE